MLGVSQGPAASAPRRETSAWEDALRGAALGETQAGGPAAAAARRRERVSLRIPPLGGAPRQRLHYFQRPLHIFFKYTGS